MNAESKAVAEVIALPTPVARRGISEAQWRTLANNLYPGADVNSVLMVWDYCIARQLDPLKKPCHIVPMRVKDAKSGDYFWRDVVMPGIYEYRTTATRTGLYMGHSKPEYGAPVEFLGVPAPEWCELTIYRWSKEANQRIEFPVRTYFRECAGTAKDKQTGNFYVNDRWSRAPVQMLTKVAEAAGLREAFPDELGGTHTEEELVGQVLDMPPAKGDGSGRPDTSEVEYTTRDKWVGQITDTLNSADLDEYGIADAIRDIDAELQKFPDLYVAVFDRLAAEKIITKANWNKTLKYFDPQVER
jgi:phage recombination protein Bet